MLTSLLRWLKSGSERNRAGRGHRRKARPRDPAARRPQLEVLEDRCLLSTSPLFDLGTPQGGPFPSDRFTVADRSQLTGRRVNLPLPDCATRPSDCADLNVINTHDGFNLQPRLSIPFSGPIDVTTVSSNTVFLVKLGDTLSRRDRVGAVVGINQVVWDVATNTLHVESDELLEQHTRYALIVTHGVRDADGEPVGASAAFRRFRREVRGEYKRDLLNAVRAARRLGVRERDIVTASVFTTQSATAILEKIRDQIHAVTPESADFKLGPNGGRTVFALDQVNNIVFNRQTGDSPPQFTSVSVPLSLVGIAPGAVGQIAFGKYVSPDYEVHPGEFIPQVGTRTGTPVVQRTNEIFFNLYLPSGPQPASGWPVAIFAHGGSGNKEITSQNIPNVPVGVSSLQVAAPMAAQGIATIFINTVGHGFGPLGTLTVNQAAGGPVTFSSGGRGIDQNGDGVIAVGEGRAAAPPQRIIGQRDGWRQTVVDLMQLVRQIEVGVDVDGDGVVDLDPARVYFHSLSQGANLGTMLVAVEPNIPVAVLNVAGGPDIDNFRLAPAPDGRPAFGRGLGARVPSLLNPPGLSEIGGVPVAMPHFNENIPLRNQPPVTNTVPGAMAIQELIENTEWVRQSGASVAYARHLRKEPLAGVPAKSVIIQFAKGDQTVVNPATTALLRAGDLADRATYYRHDLAFAEDPALPKNPHTFLISLTSTNPLLVHIALGAQAQIATFFASHGAVIIHPEPARFFEVPIRGPLPEELNYIL